MSEQNKTTEQRIQELEKQVGDLREAFLLRIDADDAANTQLRKNMGTPMFKQPPPVQQKPTSELPDMSKLNWEQMPETEVNKGRWERSMDASKPEYAAMQKLLEDAGKALFVKEFGGVYWLDQQNRRFIGRRKNEWKKQ